MARIADVETRKSAAEVGGWHNKAAMGISVAVTYDTNDKQYRFYRQEEAGELCQSLNSCDLVVGYNFINFDHEVLQPYSVFNMKDIPTLDLMVEIQKKTGKRLPLDNVAEHTLGVGKTTDGMEALRWWKEGKILEIAQYCAFDVKVTRLVAEFGAVYGCIRYSDKTSNKVITVPVDWKIPWVPESFPVQVPHIITPAKTQAPAEIPRLQPVAVLPPAQQPVAPDLFAAGNPAASR